MSGVWAKTTQRIRESFKSITALVGVSIFILFVMVLVIILAFFCDFRHSAIEIILGALLAIAVSLLMDYLRSPHLTIQQWEQGRPQRMGYDNRPFHVLHLQAVNTPMRYSRLFAWFHILRAKATDVSGTIVFRDMKGIPVSPSNRRNKHTNEPELKRMPVRWANSPQPKRTIYAGTEGSGSLKKYTLVDPERLTTHQEIRPGALQGDKDGVDDGVFSVAYQFDGEPDIYALSNECYALQWHPCDWKLTRKEYLVDVQIEASNAVCEGVFRLVLSGCAKDNQLLTISDEVKDIVKARREKERDPKWCRCHLSDALEAS